MEVDNLARFIVGKINDFSKPAYLFGDSSISYNTLISDAKKVAEYLGEAGLVNGDRLVIFLRDTPAIAEIFLAALSEGVIPIVVNPGLSESSILHILSDSGAKLVVYEAHNANTLSKALSQLKAADIKLVFQDIYGKTNDTDLEGILIEGSDKLSDFASREGSFNFVKKKENEAAFWQYTSGTTGNPKAVQHCTLTMVKNFEGFALNLHAFNSNDVFYSAAKMFFGYGFGGSFFFPLMLNATAVLDPSPAVSDLSVMQNIARYRPTIFFGSPAIYSSLIPHAKRFSDYLKGVVCISAGMALPSAVLLEWQSVYGCDIYDGIGATEIGHIYISNSKVACRPGYTGLPVPGYEIRLIAASQTPLDSVDESLDKGILWVKGSYPHLGYWNNEDANRLKFCGQWYNTGDVFLRDEDGFYKYRGRQDDLFKVNGIWVEPLFIESIVLNKISAIRECALIPSKANNDLVEPCFFYALKDPAVASLEEDLKRVFEEICEPHNFPRKILKIDALPKNDNGKVYRKALVGLV